MVWLLQLRLDPQPGTAARGEGRGRQVTHIGFLSGVNMSEPRFDFI